MYAEVVAVVQDAYTLLNCIAAICAPGLICGVLYQFPFRNRDTSLWVFLPAAMVLGFVGFGLREFYLARNLGPRLLCGTCVLTDLLAWEASFVVSMGVGACSYRGIAIRICRPPGRQHPQDCPGDRPAATATVDGER